MNREQLDARHTAVIRRHWRALMDSGGTPPAALLDDLAACHGEHAAGQPAAAPTTDTAPQSAPEPEPKPAARAPARRTTTRARRTTT